MVRGTVYEAGISSLILQGWSVYYHTYVTVCVVIHNGVDPGAAINCYPPFAIAAGFWPFPLHVSEEGPFYLNLKTSINNSIVKIIYRYVWNLILQLNTSPSFATNQLKMIAFESSLAYIQHHWIKISNIYCQLYTVLHFCLFQEHNSGILHIVNPVWNSYETWQ